jgi:hypothetical protein
MRVSMVPLGKLKSNLYLYSNQSQFQLVRIPAPTCGPLAPIIKDPIAPYKMITKTSIRLIILLILSGLFIIGFITLGLFLLYKTIISSNDLILSLSGVLFIWIGLGYYTLIAGTIKTIEINNGLLIIRKPLLRKYVEIELSSIKYLDFEWQMTWSTVRGILIKLDNGIIEKISIREFSNSKDFIDLIKKSCDRDDTIKQIIWTKELKVFMIIGLIIAVGFILLKTIK